MNIFDVILQLTWKGLNEVSPQILVTIHILFLLILI